MRVNPIPLLILPIIVSSFLPHSTQAARIWNNMPFPIVVCAHTLNSDGSCYYPLIGVREDIEVNGNSESYSFDRKTWTEVAAYRPIPGGKWGLQICGLGFGAHAQLQGGNYMVVSPPDQCVVCNSNHNPLAGGGQC